MGFTLIELLISISILAIVLLPLLNNFVTAARVNAKSKRIQNETVLAQNLMEEVKALKVVDLAARYNYPTDFPEISDEVVELVLKNERLERATEADKSVIRSTTAEGNLYTLVDKPSQPYYFARKNISLGGRKYDALITMDGTAYTTGETSAETAYNSFEMPVFSDLDTVNNLIVLQQPYVEKTATNALYINHFTYNQSLINTSPTSTPETYLEDQITSKLKKEIKVLITGNKPYSTTVSFIYSADEIPGAGSVTYTVDNKSLDFAKGSIYIFFFPSTKNTLTIQKDSLITDSIDIYAIGQKSSTLVGGELTIKDNIIPNGINLFSNSSLINSLTGGKDLVKKGQAKNRIYKVQVQLFTAGTNFNNNYLCAEFTSTKEE